MKAGSSSRFVSFRPAFRSNLFLCPKRTKKKDFHFNQVQLVSVSRFVIQPFVNSYHSYFVKLKKGLYVPNNYVFLKSININIKSCLVYIKSKVMNVKSSLVYIKSNNMKVKSSVMYIKSNTIAAAIAFSNPNFNHFHIKNTKTQPLKSNALSFWHNVKLKTMPKWREAGMFLIKM